MSTHQFDRREPSFQSSLCLCLHIPSKSARLSYACRRHLLAAELVDREMETSWNTFLSGLKARGLKGVEDVVSDNHEGLKHAIAKVLRWRRTGMVHD